LFGQILIKNQGFLESAKSIFFHLSNPSPILKKKAATKPKSPKPKTGLK